MTPGETLHVITATLSAWGAGMEPGPLMAIAHRESGFNERAIGDQNFAPKVYAAQRDRLVRDGNAWADVPDRWGGSFGLFQLMAPYHARKWSEFADPYCLFDPYIATVAAARLWNRAVQLGAKTPIDVQMVWAYGGKGLEFDHDSPEYQQRAASQRRHLRAAGYPESMATQDARSFGYSAFGLGAQLGQGEKLEIAKGTTAADKENEGAEPSHFARNTLIAAVIGGAIWYAVANK